MLLQSGCYRRSIVLLQRQQPVGANEFPTSSEPSPALFQRGASARGDIANVWQSASSGSLDAKKRVAAVQKILDTYSISATTDRMQDVTPALGEATDRLLLLTVPLVDNNTDQLSTLLGVIARNGAPLSIRTVQHLFSRVATYPEAIAIFYAMRKKNVAMDMHAYHAMIYSLQRLEEESWAQRFADERKLSAAAAAATGEGAPAASFVSEQAMDFIMNGTDNQLLPENKPWLGRMMFADCDEALAKTQTNEAFDSQGSFWVDRYRNGEAARAQFMQKKRKASPSGQK